MVELSETSEILRFCTSRSLILLDELGRGTSTNDGEAIASAVLEWITTKKQSLVVFVTHYPGLARLAQVSPSLSRLSSQN
jgi:DNA mismatch repair protein MSH3